MVLYLGRVLEIAPTRALCAQPAPPTLARCSPQRRTIPLLPGDLPSPANPKSSGVLRTRCPHAVAECARADMALRTVGADHWKACWRDDI